MNRTLAHRCWRFLFYITGLSLLAFGVNITNLADGLCHTISEKSGRDLGLIRNIMDVSCVAITCVIGFATVGRVEVIGVGTIISMVLSGRIIYLFNRLFNARMDAMAGMDLLRV